MGCKSSKPNNKDENKVDNTSSALVVYQEPETQLVTLPEKKSEKKKSSEPESSEKKKKKKEDEPPKQPDPLPKPSAGVSTVKAADNGVQIVACYKCGKEFPTRGEVYPGQKWSCWDDCTKKKASKST